MHGTIDNMITYPHGKMLVKDLGGEDSGLEWIPFEGKGHVLPLEERIEFGRLIEAVVSKTEKMQHI